MEVLSCTDSLVAEFVWNDMKFRASEKIARSLLISYMFNVDGRCPMTTKHELFIAVTLIQVHKAVPKAHGQAGAWLLARGAILQHGQHPGSAAPWQQDKQPPLDGFGYFQI